MLFLTVTGSAPISAMLFNTPIAVGFGNGIGTPAGFMFAAVILVIFSVGYVAMARKKTTAGGFYSYISHGLGREIGMGTGFGQNRPGTPLPFPADDEVHHFILRRIQMCIRDR